MKKKREEEKEMEVRERKKAIERHRDREIKKRQATHLVASLKLLQLFVLLVLS